MVKEQMCSNYNMIPFKHLPPLVVTELVFINGSDDFMNESLDIDGSGSSVIDVADTINSLPMASSPPRSIFLICFNDPVISSRRICATSLTMAQLAEMSLAAAEIEHRRIDEFGRDIHRRDWTRRVRRSQEFIA